MEGKNMIGEIAYKAIEDNRAKLVEVEKNIWENPEGPYREFKACQWTADVLKDAGFDVEIGVAGIPTAIKATWGSGHPVIGLLGEYDALPGMSQTHITKFERPWIIPWLINFLNGSSSQTIPKSNKNLFQKRL